MTATNAGGRQGAGARRSRRLWRRAARAASEARRAKSVVNPEPNPPAEPAPELGAGVGGLCGPPDVGAAIRLLWPGRPRELPRPEHSGHSECPRWSERLERTPSAVPQEPAVDRGTHCRFRPARTRSRHRHRHRRVPPRHRSGSSAPGLRRSSSERRLRGSRCQGGSTEESDRASRLRAQRCRRPAPACDPDR